jgi:hypothetical protein
VELEKGWFPRSSPIGGSSLAILQAREAQGTGNGLRHENQDGSIELKLF